MKRSASLTLALAGLALLAGSAPPQATQKEEVAAIQTRLGRILFRFFPGEAPGHVASVKELIRRGFYDGTTFHRVIPHFVIQGGDPNSRDADRSNDGDGEADRRLRAEFSTRLHYRPGTVGMARDVDPDSGSCQFFIALENVPRLDGKYTIFGEVISGMEVARAIAEEPRDLRDNPVEPIPMKVALQSMKLPLEILSAKEGPSGEVLTGPGKPKSFDPGDVRWKPPAPAGREGGMDAQVLPEGFPLDLSVSEDGRVLDVRFARLDTPRPGDIVRELAQWRFTPGELEGSPVKARFSLQEPGDRVGPSLAPRTPVDVKSEDLVLPKILVPVEVPAGAKLPAQTPELRLTLDETGHVADVSLQSSSGDRALDEAALKAARGLVFAPAMRGKDPVAVYLNLRVQWESTLPP